MSPLRWTTLSTCHLATELTAQGHRISADIVADLLREEGFSLQGNAKTLESKESPDRDAQFRYLNEQVREHRDVGQPVISVDTKKKELVGEFKNSGREWAPTGEPVKVGVHDFADPELGKAVPYGVYDLAANAGWVNVGCDHDTAAFAVESIRRWWNGQGKHTYPRATRLLITADAGGSNGYRIRAWKIELATLAAQTGLTVTVCHLPPGTSKWNRIEHRLFSHITMNWRGRPLTSHEVIVATIAATTTRTGLRVHAELDTGSYSIRPASRSATPTWPACPSPSTPSTVTGTMSCTPRWQAPTRPVTLSPRPRGGAKDVVRPRPDRMSRTQLDSLTAALAELHHTQPGAGIGRPPRLSFSHQVLTAVLHFRLALPAEPLAVLFGSSRAAVHRTFHKIKRLLDQHGTAIPPAASPPAALAALHARALALGDPFTNKIKSAC
jgi:hypothetical protein